MLRAACAKGEGRSSAFSCGAMTDYKGAMMNLIDGIKIEVTSDELKATLVERRNHHKAKAAFYCRAGAQP